MLRADAERLRAANREARTPERLLAHFEVERALARRLATAERDNRGAIYGQLYDALFAAVPDHPQHNADPARRRHDVGVQVQFLRRFGSPDGVFAEIGCGDGAVAQGLAPFFSEVIGVDVTSSLINIDSAPANFRFAPADGAAIRLPDDTADLIYSNQLMEHLHPDDATDQLREILRILKPGGRYICVTPSRITGPHDISVYFGYEPQGFHLREYSYRELARLFREVGFGALSAHARVKGRDVFLSLALLTRLESCVAALPRRLRVRATQMGALRNILGLTMIGEKPLIGS